MATPETAQKREDIITTAQTWAGTKYNYGGNSSKGIDCSHFVWQVYKATVDPLMAYQTTSAMKSDPKFTTVTTPEKGDIVLWDGHVGIVVDPTMGTFIGAQSSTGVAESNYKTNLYWSVRPNRIFRRLNTLQ
ncbi:MAG: C40 family peptidase [Gemmataceae bacterium]